uniref:Uncharacterized protein n=1 Tax=Setaria viridis TaxID=4556 RepID=A0A4U6VV98_SETVI|nr:hypothetical protein SEVIR_2G226400v2 [Setaria viridis]
MGTRAGSMDARSCMDRSQWRVSLPISSLTSSTTAPTCGHQSSNTLAIISRFTMRSPWMRYASWKRCSHLRLLSANCLWSSSEKHFWISSRRILVLGSMAPARFRNRVKWWWEGRDSRIASLIPGC